MITWPASLANIFTEIIVNLVERPSPVYTEILMTVVEDIPKHSA